MKFDFEMQFLNGGHWWDQQFSVDQQGTTNNATRLNVLGSTLC